MVLSNALLGQEVQEDALNYSSRSTNKENNDSIRCENVAIVALLNNELAYIKKRCYRVFGEKYSFVIVLVNRPDIEYYFSNILYPIEGIPEEFQKNGLPILVSGNILDCKHIVACEILPNARYAAQHLFELKTIKKR